MPATFLIEYTCKELPCTNKTAVIKVINVTSEAGDESKKADYDSLGAMHFIVATILVYSLIGVLGTLLMRIKRSATRTQRTVTMQEESLHEYLKVQDMLVLEGRRERMRTETKRVTGELNTRLTRPLSRDSTTSSTTNYSEESSFLLTPRLSSSEGTLNVSPRSPLGLPLKFNFKDVPVSGLPSLPETSGEDLVVRIPNENRMDVNSDESFVCRPIAGLIHQTTNNPLNVCPESHLENTSALKEASKQTSKQAMDASQTDCDNNNAPGCQRGHQEIN